MATAPSSSTRTVIRRATRPAPAARRSTSTTFKRCRGLFFFRRGTPACAGLAWRAAFCRWATVAANVAAALIDACLASSLTGIYRWREAEWCTLSIMHSCLDLFRRPHPDILLCDGDGGKGRRGPILLLGMDRTVRRSAGGFLAEDKQKGGHDKQERKKDCLLSLKPRGVLWSSGVSSTVWWTARMGGTSRAGWVSRFLLLNLLDDSASLGLFLFFSSGK